MTAAAATVTDMRDNAFPGYRVCTFATTLGATATDGVEIYLGWSNVDNVHISCYNSTPAAIGASWQYSAGTLTLYAPEAGNAATVKVTVLGQD